MRSFRSAEEVSAEFLPYLARIVSPDVKPVVVGGSQGSIASVRKDTERAMVKRAAEVLAEVGIELQKGRIESDSPVDRNPQYVYRMEP
jgi:chromosome transmission fidelity protein 18